MTEIFGFTDYRAYLEKQIAEHSGERGYQTRLAKAAGCKGSFLSQVLHSHVNLTPDHAASLCHFWNFTDDETDWFLELLNMARSGSAEMRKVCARRLKEIEKRRANLNERLKPSRILGKEAQGQYYSAWFWSAIHMMTCIPAYQTVSRIAVRLGLRESLIRDSLKTLEKMGLVKNKDSRWLVAENNIHIPKDSALNSVNHINWRSRAIFEIQNNGDEDALHYTAVHALSRKDISKIQEILIQTIKQTREIVEPSAEEELICVTCDVFKV